MDENFAVLHFIADEEGVPFIKLPDLVKFLRDCAGDAEGPRMFIDSITERLQSAAQQRN